MVGLTSLICTTLFISASVVFCSISHPCGIQLGRIKCSEIVGCRTFMFSKKRLACCWNGNKPTSLEFQDAEFVQMNTSLPEHCEYGARVITTKQGLHVCRTVTKVKQTLSIKNQLFAACKEGFLQKVQYILDVKQVGINMVSSRGLTPVMFAVKEGHKSIFDYLVSKGCNLEMTDHHNLTVLHYASMAGNIEIVKALLKMERIDKEARCHDGSTPLLRAAGKGNMDVYRYLKRQGCNTMATDVMGANALHYSCISQNVQLVEYLLRDFDINCRTSIECTPAMCAAINDNIKVLKYLVEKRCNLATLDKFGNDLLHVACQRDSINVIRELIVTYNFNIDSLDSLKRTPLFVAVFHKSGRVLSFLESHGCNILAVDQNGDNALTIAARFTNVQIVKQLIGYNKFDINAQGFGLQTPLMAATVGGKLDIFRVLVESGADYYKFDNKGQNVLHIASCKGHADIVREITSKNLVSIDSADDHGDTAVMMAAKDGHYEVFQILVKVRASLDVVNANGDTLFHLACKGGSVKIVRELMRQGRGHQKRNARNQTPTQVAAKNVIAFLLKEMRNG